MTPLGWFLFALGVMFICDGGGSIAKYWNQTLVEHLVRVLRAAGGVALISVAVLLHL